MKPGMVLKSRECAGTIPLVRGYEGGNTLDHGLLRSPNGGYNAAGKNLTGTHIVPTMRRQFAAEGPTA